MLDAMELAEDPRFASNRDRMNNLGALTEVLNEKFRHATTDEWMARLEEAGVPAGPVLDIAEMHADPQALAREMVVETEHSTVGPVKTIGLPIKFSETPGGVAAGAPRLGEHSREILAEHGYAADEIDRLIAAKAVIAADETGDDR